MKRLLLFVLVCILAGCAAPDPAPAPDSLRRTRTPSIPAATATWTPSFGTAVPAASATASPTAPPATATVVATPTPKPTTEATGTPGPFPTPTLAALPTPASDHDTSTCHGAETGDGHTHGHCWFDLPAGPIRSYIEANPVFGQVGHPWHSSPTENLYPWPVGAHEGHKFIYEEYDECHKFVNTGGAPDGPCVWAAYFAPHSTGIAEEIYKPPLSVHSQKWVLDTCPAQGAPATPEQDCIVASGDLAVYGEVHNEYKTDYCTGLLPGLIQYPAGLSVEQPPYVAVNKTLMGNVYEALGYPRPNNLLQVAWIESTWEGPNPDPLLCGNPLYDVVACASSAAGCENSRFWLFTFEVKIAEYPRPFDGFVDRLGDPASGCTEMGHDCIPLHIGADVPPGDVFFNRPVQPDDTPFLDYAEPNLFMPGTAP